MERSRPAVVGLRVLIKSPGPDGLSFYFYVILVLIEDDVFGVWVISYNGDIPKGCNSNFIALIPKIIDANMVKDFRPISLIGSLYKIIAKLLANRLVGVLSNLINENAYDSVRWDFLAHVLDKFGFGVKWSNWDSGCFRSSRGRSFNGRVPTEEFQSFDGLNKDGRLDKVGASAARTVDLQSFQVRLRWSVNEVLMVALENDGSFSVASIRQDVRRQPVPGRR
ncbi:hypothetical protein Tco_1059673 [Tanacetum coccineum]